MRQDFAAVNFKSLFFFAAHQVNVELRDADAAQSLQLLAMLFDRTDQAKTVDYLISDEIGVVAANFTVMKVIVFAAILHKRSQRRRELFGLVLGNQIENVIGDQRR